MNKVLSLALLFLTLMGGVLVAATLGLGERPAIDLSQVPDDAMLPGRIKIKLCSQYSDLAERLNFQSSSLTRFGVEQLDAINQKYGVRQVERVFGQVASAEKHRDRHRQWGFNRWFNLYLDSRDDIRDIVLDYRNLAGIVEWAEPEFRKELYWLEEDAGGCDSPDQPRWLPNDPRFPDQWHYHNTGQQDGMPDCDIDLPEAWEVERGLSSVTVAIIDQGIQINHPDLAANIWANPGEIPGNWIDDDGNGFVDDVNGYNFIRRNGNIESGDHGCHTSGTIAAVSGNGIGVSGIAGGNGSGDGVRLMSCQVFNHSASGGFAAAIIYAADNGACICQNSWGYTGPDYYERDVLDAIDYFNSNGGGESLLGGITIFAAGNGNRDGNWYPACYSGSFSVAATNNKDVKTFYSNYGNWVDVSAPGGETRADIARGVLSTLSNGTHGFLQGTSMACPHVSGVAALLISYARRHNITLSREEVMGIIKNSADNISNLNPDFEGKLGSGRINAFKALESALPGSPPLITWDPQYVYQHLPPEQTGTQTMAIGNLGTKILSYRLSQPFTYTILLDEGFSSAQPTGWSQNHVKGNLDWTFRPGSASGYLNRAYEGLYNANLYSATSTFTTQLVTPMIDISTAVPASGVLSFWHIQPRRTIGTVLQYQDVLRVFYYSANGIRIKLAEYTGHVPVWTQRSIQLPDLRWPFQLVFEATTNTGWGVCLDKVQLKARLVHTIGWYSINGTSSFSGIVGGNLQDQDLVTLGFNAAGLAPGIYSSRMSLSSNSATHSYADIPVTLEVGGPPLMVNLSALIALIDYRNHVRIDWVTLAECSAMGFRILRNDTDDLATAFLVSPLIEATNTSQTQYYSYTDCEVDPDATYYYWLQNLDLDGVVGYHGPIRITVCTQDEYLPGSPFVNCLHSAFPNPFNPSTTIPYTVDRPGPIRMDIYNCRGQLVREYSRQHWESGTYYLVFDGKDSRGVELPGGVYLYRLSSNNFQQTHRMVLMK